MSTQIGREIDEILHGTTSSILSKLEELKESIETSHDRYWTKQIGTEREWDMPPFDIFKLDKKPLDVLKALSLDDSLTIADRLVLTIIWNNTEVTTDTVINLTCMSPVGVRRCLKKLTSRGLIFKIKNNLYTMSNSKIF